jgi:NAD(P)-dependent dehydrogenase (short-subunit alcohol dehydrogenase family)
MPSLAAVRASNAAFSPSYIPVALFVGGTAGIGQGITEAFARHVKGNAHIVIIGRNRAASESIISQLPKPTSDTNVTHEFVQCDVSLMKNVHATTKELLTRMPKINFLVMSPGYMTTKGRDETEEGIDKKLAVHYYARWKFISDLLPALKKAKESGEDAKVLSVLATGKGGEIDLNDLGLKKTFTLSSAALQAPTYNDLMMEVSRAFLTSERILIVTIGIRFSKSGSLIRPCLSRNCPHNAHGFF